MALFRIFHILQLKKKKKRLYKIKIETQKTIKQQKHFGIT